MPLALGEPAPWFKATTPSNPEFVFDTAGEALRMLAAQRNAFDDARASAFVVVRDPATAATARDLRGLRWFLDLDGAVSRLYGALAEDGEEHPIWLLLDPT